MNTNKAIDIADELINMEVKISSPTTRQMKNEIQSLVDSIQHARIEKELSLEKYLLEEKKRII